MDRDRNIDLLGKKLSIFCRTHIAVGHRIQGGRPGPLRLPSAAALSHGISRPDLRPNHKNPRPKPQTTGTHDPSTGPPRPNPQRESTYRIYGSIPRSESTVGLHGQNPPPNLHGRLDPLKLRGTIVQAG